MFQHSTVDTQTTVLIMWITNLRSYITRLHQENKYLVHLDKNPSLFSEKFETHKYTSRIKFGVFNNTTCGTYIKHGGSEG